MNKKRLQSVVQLMLAASFLASSLMTTVEAARAGSGRRSGVSRTRPALRSSNEIQSARSAPTATPSQSSPSAAQPQPAPAANQNQLGTAAVRPIEPSTSPAKRSWLAPLAGVAAGFGLAHLLGGSANASAGDTTGIGMNGLWLVLGAAGLWWLWQRRRTAQKVSDQYATQAPAYAARPESNELERVKQGWTSAHEIKDAFVNTKHTVSFASEPSFTTTGNPKEKVLPDQNAFLHAARQYFLSLQAAFDKGDLEPFRDWMVPELRDDLIEQIKERNQAVNQTEVLTLSADVLEEKADADANWVTVRFNGTTRESPDPTPKVFNEAWHFKQCRRTSNDPWKLAGIDPLT